jgi:hypothetical protein
MKVLKFVLVILLVTLVLATSQNLFVYKTSITSEAYSDILFTRLAVETQTYTRQIEYGLKNGKSLEHFYGINTILQDVKRCYSYTNGVYIVSSDYSLLYAVADSKVDSPTRMNALASEDSDRSYLIYDDADRDRYLMSVPIYGQNETMSGYMLLSIDHAAVDNTLESSYRENLIQSAVCAALAAMLGVLLIIHQKKRPKHFLTDAGVICALTSGGYIFADGALSVYKLYVRMETIIGQSVSKIVMALQYDLNSVGEKGVAFSKIYDLNSFLLESCEQVPYLETLIYDKNYQISAVISKSYILQKMGDNAGRMGLALLYGAVIGLGLILLGVLIDLLRSYLRTRKEKMSRRKKKMTAQEKKALEILADDELQNAMLIRAIRRSAESKILLYHDSVAIREAESGQWMFSLKEKGDFKALHDMMGTEMSYTFLITDEGFYDEVCAIMETADGVRYNQFVIDTPRFIPEDRPLPPGVELVKIDRSWMDFILEHYSSREFGNEAYVGRCLDENPAYGALLNGKKVGFHLSHLNGEMGPIMVLPEARGLGLAKLLSHIIMPEYLEGSDIGAAMVLPSNGNCQRMVSGTNLKVAPKHVVWMYARDVEKYVDSVKLIPKKGEKSDHEQE